MLGSQQDWAESTESPHGFPASTRAQPPYPHPPPQWPICFHWQSNIDRWLSPKGQSPEFTLHWLVLYILWIWTYLSLRYYTEYFRHPTNPLCSACSSLPLTPGDHRSFCCLRSFAFSRVSYTSGRHLSFSRWHLGFLCVFSGLDSSFLLSTD